MNEPTPTAWAAADRYIAERRGKRDAGVDIPYYERYTEVTQSLAYGGIRRVDGQALALLRHGDQVLVMPVDGSTAVRLARWRLGASVTVSSEGAIKKLGSIVDHDTSTSKPLNGQGTGQGTGQAKGRGKGR